MLDLNYLNKENESWKCIIKCIGWQFVCKQLNIFGRKLLEGSNPNFLLNPHSVALLNMFTLRFMFTGVVYILFKGEQSSFDWLALDDSLSVKHMPFHSYCLSKDVKPLSELNWRGVYKGTSCPVTLVDLFVATRLNKQVAIYRPGDHMSH